MLSLVKLERAGFRRGGLPSGMDCGVPIHANICSTSLLNYANHCTSIYQNETIECSVILVVLLSLLNNYCVFLGQLMPIPYSILLTMGVKIFIPSSNGPCPESSTASVSFSEALSLAL